MGILEIVKQNCELDERILERINQIPCPRIEGTLKLREKENVRQTYIKLKGDDRYRYASKHDPKMQANVNRLKLKRFLEESRKVLERNIALQKNFAEKYVSYNDELINAQLAPAYRYDYKEKVRNKIDRQSQNPYRRDLLIHKTSAGIFVRSKGEVVIADVLDSLGIDFFYEKKLVLLDEAGNERTLYPDFTILLRGGRIYYWEHEGMLTDLEYARRNQEKEQLYFRNGIYAPKNLIVSMDGADGSIDADGIRRMAQALLVPLM